MIKKIEYFLYDLLNAFKNVYRFRRTLWRAKPWDYTGIYYALQDQIQSQLDSVQRYSLHAKKDRDIKQMKVCLFLLDRLIKDEYILKYTKDLPASPDDIELLSMFDIVFVPRYDLPKGKTYKLEQSVEKNDRELLFKILNRNSNSWWH